VLLKKFTNNKFKRTILSVPRKKLHKLIITIIYITLSIALSNIVVFQSYYNYWKWKPSYAPYRSILPEYEIEAINFVRNYVPQEYRIISDPETARIFTSLTGPGRVYLLGFKYRIESSCIETNIAYFIKYHIFLSNTSYESYQAIQLLKDIIIPEEKPFLEFVNKSNHRLSLGKFIVIISRRTAWWIDKEGVAINIREGVNYPVKQRHIRLFINKQYFELIYRIEGKIYIFIVK